LPACNSPKAKGSKAIRTRILSALVVLAVCVGGRQSLARKVEQQMPAPPRPAVPAIASLELKPKSLVLSDPSDARQVLVWGVTDDGRKFDLGYEAIFKADPTAVKIEAGNYLSGLSAGESTVTVTAEGKQVSLAVKVISGKRPAVRFTHDVMPLLAGVGCNAGTCHGAAKGKDGFKLSLRGYDPEFDYNALVNELQGRRVNRVDPANSLMLLKPAAQVPHEGGLVLPVGGRQYETILQWIKEGAKYEPDPGTARPSRLEVLPAEAALDLPGRTQKLIVLAHYPDGSTRDVTRDAVLTSNSIDTVRVTGSEIVGMRRGEASVGVRYEGNYGVVSVSIMGDRTGFVWAPMPVYNYVDTHINTKLEKMKILPSDECTDAEFVRRIYLDLTGLIPTAKQARAFVEDPTPSREKRLKLIDKLLGSGDFVDFWSNKWADLLQCNSKTLGDEGVWVFREWIREAVAQNMPYDQFVRTLVTAEGSSLDNPPVNYMRTLRDTGKITEDVSQTFLGVRFSCNKCHDHPFERWTQSQYYEMGAFFARLAFKPGTRPGEEIVFDNFRGGEVTNPRTTSNVDPKVPYGQNPDWKSSRVREVALADWLVSKDNPFFAKSYVNRVWSYFFGRGIIDPVDDIRASNPPVNPELLDALTEDFVRSGFDVQHLIRRIVTSRTYGLSVKSNQWNHDDRINFSHEVPRRLTAEQMMNAVAIATGTKTRLNGLPEGVRPEDLADGMNEGSDFLKLFGRPKRETACECERTSNVSLAHALNLINGHLISDSCTSQDNALAKLVAREPDNRKVVEELYYMTMSRPPTGAEVKLVDLGSGAQRLAAAEDLAWALMNSPAFLFNR
jgi:hypothetical protein